MHLPSNVLNKAQVEILRDPRYLPEARRKNMRRSKALFEKTRI